MLNINIVALSAVLDLLIKRQVENKWDKKSLRYVLEETVKLGVNLVGYHGKVFRTVLVVQIVGLDDKDLSLIVLDPLLVSFIQVAEVLDADALLIVPSSFLNL